MNIFDFITEEEISDLPEDPALAFMTFVRVAQHRLFEREKELSSADKDYWNLIDEARHGFMNVVVAAAKQYRIKPFVSMEVPRVGKFDNDVHRQFKADLDHYITQLVLDGSIRGRRESVLLPESSRDKIRTYLHGLKVEIDKAEFTEAKRADLLAKLAKFEAALDGRRLNLMEVMMFAVAVLGLPGTTWASYEIVAKLTTNVVATVAEAKVVDDENRRLAPVEKPAALSPPRKEEPQLRGSDMDDEIPF